MSAVMALRQQHKESFQRKHGVKLGFMSFFVKAVIEVAQADPADQRRDSRHGHRLSQLLRHRHRHRRRQGAGGARAPRRRADELRRDRADDRRLRPPRTGRTRSGPRNSKAARSPSPTAASTARCSPRRSSIRRKAASSACTPSRSGPWPASGQVVIRPMMYLALTYDHRIVDGREAVIFLRRIKEMVEEPSRMLLEV